ncbi:MAG: heavy metal translocating P-type ATPase [Phycisphaerales bacterium]
MTALPAHREVADRAERVRLDCAHCDLPVPAGLVEEGAAHQFCCAACRTAYEVIHACGLDRYYALRERTASKGEKARGVGERFERFDDPAFTRLYCSAAPEGLLRTSLRLDGVHCAACVWLVEALPRVAEGVVEARLDLGRNLVHLVWDPAAISLSRAARALDSLGYRPSPAHGLRDDEARRRDERRALARLGVAGALAGNIMLLAFALYSGAFADMAPGTEAFFRWTSAGLGVIAIAWPGSVFFRGAWASLRVRRLHLDLPIAIALFAGAAWGVVSVATGRGEIYFDSLSAVVFLLLIGRYLQQRQQRRATNAVEMLFTMTPTRVRIVEGEAIRAAPIDEVRVGDVVEAPANDSVPVDGVVVEGRSELDQSLLTGESRAVPVGPGDRVTAGAMNLASTLRVRVDAAGEETRIAGLMRTVERSAMRRAPIVRMADRIAGRFVAAVLGLAAGTLLLWLWLDPAHAIDHAMALLIVTCPCALGLATPLAVSVALGRAARRGLLIKGGAPLELLSAPGVLLLDKTGVVTESRMRLVRWVGEESLRPVVGEAERDSAHPVGRALAAGLDDGASRLCEVSHRIGRGVEASLDGEALQIGSPAFIEVCAGALPAWVSDAAAELAREGLTPVVVALGGAARAVAGVGAPLREDAQASVDAIRAAGWRVGMLSGDHPDVVHRVAERLGLEADLCWGGATPEAKLRVVESLVPSGTVVMVGDGVNDAASLAAATVGVAVHGGAEASLEAADVSVSRPGLAPIVELLAGSDRAARVIRRNLRASLFYNAVTASLAVGGVLGPLLAAALMPLSSITVITLSHRSRTFGEE